MIGILMLIFSISLIPENIGFNFTFELRPLVFAVLICGLILQFGFSVWRNDVKLKQTKIKFVSIDLAYALCVLLTIISFVTKTLCINAFHYVFVAVGMFGVYSVVRFVSSDEILLQSKIIYSVVGIGFIVALIGLFQFATGKPVVSTFGRTSYLGCFLAMNVPIAFGLMLATNGSCVQSKVEKSKVEGRKRLSLLLIYSSLTFLVILAVTVLTKSRSAMIALTVVLPLMMIRSRGWKVFPINLGFKVGRFKGKYSPKYHLKGGLFVRAWMFGLLLLALGSAAYCGKYLYKIKPMSASGRTLIWKVSAEMFKKDPFTGVGFGNFASSYNLYQANFLGSGKGTIVNKMTAGQIRHAYNWYLETAAEFGIFGLIVFGIFWWLIMVEVYRVFFPRNTRKDTENLIMYHPALSSTPKFSGHGPPRQGGEFTGHGSRTTDYLTLGMSGAVLCFMIMSLFQFPRKIIPTYLIFNVALAWIVNANLVTQKSQETQVNYQNNFKEQSTKNKAQNRWLKIVWISAGMISLFFVVIYFQRYLAARQWHKAHDLACAGKYKEAENVYSSIYPKLKWNGRFLSYYGNMLLQNEKYSEAIELFEKAKFTYPDPYLFENLGVAYINYQQFLTNKKSRREATNKAINYWILSSNILPWRLTPKYYLADLFYQIGDTNEAIKYAQLVVNTPMKKWTERGKKFKLKSQKMLKDLRMPGLIELGEECDDPGLIVFDIHEKKTWNEGAW